MRITLTQEELAIIAEIAVIPLPVGVDVAAYTVNQNLTVEKNNAGVSVMRGPINQTNSIYAPGTK